MGMLGFFFKRGFLSHLREGDCLVELTDCEQVNVNYRSRHLLCTSQRTLFGHPGEGVLYGMG